MSGCALRSNGEADFPATAGSAPVLHVPGGTEGKYVWLEVKHSSGKLDGFEGTLTALLQSDRGLLLADSTADADYVVRVELLAPDVTGYKEADVEAGDVVAPLLVGALGGTAVGGRGGAAWGAGLGAALGLGVAWASNHDKTNAIFTLHADVSILRKTGQGAPKEYTSRMTANAEVQNNNPPETAIPILESTLAAEIVRAFDAEEKP